MGEYVVLISSQVEDNVLNQVNIVEGSESYNDNGTYTVNVIGSPQTTEPVLNIAPSVISYKEISS